MNNGCGFTLVETLIVVAILGILAAVAYPSYIESVQKSRRTDAKEALTKAAALQERWYLQGNQYASTADIDNIGGAASVAGYYRISTAFQVNGTHCADADDRRCFTLTATAQNAQLGDEECRRFTLDNLGRKRGSDANGAPNDRCW